jgi:UDP-hydrolysing UDP-N-acetyl-D-glucosamine 2-epimerase
MTRRRVCIIITTRGNYAKMKSVIRHVQRAEDLELQLIVGGGAILPKYGDIMASPETRDLRVDRVIHFLVEGENPVAMAKSAGLAVTEFSTAFENLRPHVVVVIADRFECLAIAMAASYMNVPLAHVEGGEVSGSIDESVRHAISKLSHLHFPATSEAAERLVRMGEDPATVFPVGCSSLDVIAELDLEDLGPVTASQETRGVGARVDLSRPYLVVIQHPVTTEYDLNLAHVQETIEAVESLGMPTVWVWPNMDAGSDGISKGLRVYRETRHPQRVHFFKSLTIEHYAPLLRNAACILGNSSSGIRESAFLGTPSVNIGSRQTGRERGRNVADVPYDRHEIAAAVHRQLAHGRYEPDHVYGDGKAGERIVDVLRSFRFNLQKRIVY